MTDQPDMQELAETFGFDPNIEDDGTEQETTEVASTAERATEASEKARERDDRQADDLIGRQIGPWTVIAKRERHETKSGKRAVYVIQHRDGFTKGLKGYRLNAMVQQAINDGLA